MVRIIEGQGFRRIRKPPRPSGTLFPCSSTTSGSMPGKAIVAEPGFRVVSAGSGVIRIEPVSVCHQVSTTGQRSPPMWVWYHIHASGLIGSPTLPSRRSDDRSCLAGKSAPHFMNARIGVGAVYGNVTPYDSTID